MQTVETKCSFAMAPQSGVYRLQPVSVFSVLWFILAPRQLMLLGAIHPCVHINQKGTFTAYLDFNNCEEECQVFTEVVHTFYSIFTHTH